MKFSIILSLHSMGVGHATPFSFVLDPFPPLQISLTCFMDFN